MKQLLHRNHFEFQNIIHYNTQSGLAVQSNFPAILANSGSVAFSGNNPVLCPLAFTLGRTQDSKILKAHLKMLGSLELSRLRTKKCSRKKGSGRSATAPFSKERSRTLERSGFNLNHMIHIEVQPYFVTRKTNFQ